jgi:hypothetical protein
VSVLRRGLLLLALAFVSVASNTLVASASYADSARVPTSIATGTVSAPTDVTVVRSSCSNGRWIEVTITCRASSTPRISGYAVTAYWADGQVAQLGTTGSGITSLVTTFDKHEGVPVACTVTTTTSYGWSAESLRAAPAC